MKTRVLIVMILIACGGACFAQNSGAQGNSTVKVDSLNVYSDTRTSSDVVRAMKKGDSLFVTLELKTSSEKWCSVRLPGEAARLGYVECDGLERTDRRTGDLALPAGSVPMSVSVSSAPMSAASVPPAPINITRTHPTRDTSGEYDKVAALVVREGVLDGAKIAELEQEAEGGAPTAMRRAAYAHQAAADFELDHNDPDSAIQHYLAAVPLSAKQPAVLFGTLIGLSYIHLVRSEYSAALEFILQARRIEPDSAFAAQLSGWAYYGLNRLDDAIKEWDVAQRLNPEPTIERLLEKARNDLRVEQETRVAETSHFTIHYQGNATPQLAVEILHTLENHFRSIQSILNYTPAEPIGVILYTDQSFRDITRAPSWAIGWNDGRIRVPVQGVGFVTDDLSRVLRHELTHSFVKQLTLGNCPAWLHEGVAQWIEGRATDADEARVMIAAYERGKSVPLSRLESSWKDFPDLLASYAYAWSLAAVESIVANGGPQELNRLLGSLGTASSVDGALRQTLQIGYADLDRQTVEYLRKAFKK